MKKKCDEQSRPAVVIMGIARHDSRATIIYGHETVGPRPYSESVVYPQRSAH